MGPESPQAAQKISQDGNDSDDDCQRNEIRQACMLQQQVEQGMVDSEAEQRGGQKAEKRGAGTVKAVIGKCPVAMAKITAPEGGSEAAEIGLQW